MQKNADESDISRERAARALAGVEEAFRNQVIFLKQKDAIFQGHPSWGSEIDANETETFTYIDSLFKFGGVHDVAVRTWKSRSTETPIGFPYDELVVQHLESFLIGKIEDVSEAAELLADVASAAVLVGSQNDLDRLEVRGTTCSLAKVDGMTITIAHESTLNAEFFYELGSPINTPV